MHKITFQGNCPKCRTYYSNQQKCVCGKFGDDVLNIDEESNASMSEFTKGEWKFHSGIDVIFSNTGTKIICAEIRNDEIGYLLASAPELLEACEKLLPYVESDWERNDGTFGEATKDIEFAKKAIAKAIGKN